MVGQTKSADEHGNAHQRNYPKASKLSGQVVVFSQNVIRYNPSAKDCLIR
jgi:hypothetical protein